MGVNGRRKGAKNENQLAKWFTAWWGERFRRTPMSGGWSKGYKKASGDIVSVEEVSLFPFSMEAKKVEGWKFDDIWLGKKTDIWKWWKQTLDDSKASDQIPMLVFTRNRYPWFVMVKQMTGKQLENYHSYTGRKMAFRGPYGNVHIYEMEPFLESLDIAAMKKDIKKHGALKDAA